MSTPSHPTPTTNMFSPPRREKARGSPKHEPRAGTEDHLPKGDCRYILLHPEVKGLRCACVGFALNRGMPGSMCECGHQACYHTPDKEGTIERGEVEALLKKVEMLQEELERQRRGEVIERVGKLEEMVEKRDGERDAEIKSIYRGMSSLWTHVGLLTKRTPYYDDHIEGLVDDVQRMRDRLVEFDDAAMQMEDRVEALEQSVAPSISRRRKASTPPSGVEEEGEEESEDSSVKSEETVTTTTHSRDLSQNRFPLHLVLPEEVSRVEIFRERVSSVGSGAQAWTVHISLLPTSSQPFPFEKDTAAYKRCLSRGLHQIIVIPDTDSTSFRNAVSTAFQPILRGRPWHPLVARICDAKNLCGLPMLRQLPSYLLGSDYSAAFLRQHCAVNDDSGKILDLYIAMSDDTISWAELRDVEPFKPGLEASWIYDPFLDGVEGGLEGVESVRPAAGDLLPSWSPSLKRDASQISRTPSFGSVEGEAARKLQRARAGAAGVEVVRRNVETV